MNLAIFTPALTTSAIGRATRLVVQSLISQGHTVVVIRSEDIPHLEKPTHDFGVQIINWNDAPEVKIAVQNADMLVYQIGNNYQFHRGCMEWLPVYSGIVCLHDFFLGHLFHEWANYRRPVAQLILREWYGPEIAETYFSIESDFIERTQDRAPMTEWICSMALGVVTHSSWAIQRVLDSCPGPVHVIALPYDMPETDGAAPAEVNTGEKMTVLTIGHINPNKRVDSVIRAIGQSPRLRDSVNYQLVGSIESSVAHDLAALAATLQVKLKISGVVDDLALRQAIDKADVMCCLRMPALEAASASVIESMLCGKATIVMDTGFYSELPDEYVRKISPERELEDLTASLEKLCMDSTERTALGRNAAIWAHQHFTSEKYARGLVSFAESIGRSVPVIEMCNFYTDVLQAWGPMPDESMEQIISLLDTGVAFPELGKAPVFASDKFP